MHPVLPILLLGAGGVIVASRMRSGSSSSSGGWRSLSSPVSNRPLSEHFNLAELTRTSTGKPNNPPPEVVDRLAKLAQELERVRHEVGPMQITSGWRSAEVNRAVGGSKTSDHLLARAVDFVPVHITSELAYLALKAQRKRLGIDQLIWYRDANRASPRGHVHVGFRANPRHEAWIEDG